MPPWWNWRKALTALVGVGGFVGYTASDYLDWLGKTGPWVTALALVAIFEWERIGPWLVRVWRRVPPSKRKLRREAVKTSDGIRTLAEHYDGAAVHEVPWWRRPEWQRMTEAEREKAFYAHSYDRALWMRTIMDEYDKEFSVDALWLYDEFDRRGDVGDVDRSRFEHPTNTLGLRDIAQHLGVWGRRL